MSFKFNIGDVLVHAATLAPPVPSANVRLYVVERTEQTCPGGTQRHYLCRVVGVATGYEQHVNVTHGLVPYNEAELAPFGDYLAALESQRAEARKAREGMEASLAAAERVADKYAQPKPAE